MFERLYRVCPFIRNSDFWKLQPLPTHNTVPAHHFATIPLPSPLGVESTLRNQNHSNDVISVLLLVADTQLYDRLCPSVRWSIGPLVHRSLMIESKSVVMRIYDAAVMIVWVCEWAWDERGYGWGLYAPAHWSAMVLWPCVACYQPMGIRLKVSLSYCLSICLSSCLSVSLSFYHSFHSVLSFTYLLFLLLFTLSFC